MLAAAAEADDDRTELVVDVENVEAAAVAAVDDEVTATEEVAAADIVVELEARELVVAANDVV